MPTRRLIGTFVGVVGVCLLLFSLTESRPSSATGTPGTAAPEVPSEVTAEVCGNPVVPPPNTKLEYLAVAQGVELRYSLHYLGFRRGMTRWRAMAGSDEIDVERECAVDGSLADPWTTLVELGGLQLEHPRRLWRIPRELENGVTYRGEQSTSVPGLDVRVTMRSEFRVVNYEPVEVPAGSFEAWRVNVRSSDGSSGTLWLSRDVGLIKSVMHRDGTSRVELMAIRSVP